MAITSNPITWQEHGVWFEKKLNDPNCKIYIAEDEQQQPVGQIRFDLDNNNIATVDISISARHRNKGLGSNMLSLAIDQYLPSTQVKCIQALVKKENTRSKRLFENTGFSPIGSKIIGQQHYDLLEKRVYLGL